MKISGAATDIKKILVINPYGIGDVLFTTPVISNLRRAYPQVYIAYLANARTADFLKADPDIQQVFIYERDEFVGKYQKYFELFNSIKQQAFDVVFDFSLNSSFGFLCAACGIKKRIGFDYRGRGRFLTDKIPMKGYEGKHVIEYYLELLGPAQVPVVDKNMALIVTPKDIQWAKDWIAKQGINPAKPVIGVVPGGGQSWGKAAGNKRWSASKYAQLVDKIIENFDAVIILLGDSKEEQLCREVAGLSHFPLHLAAGQTSVLGMAALFKQCRLALVNDGGPLHVAVAAGVKTVSIFGPVDPQVYGPYPPTGHITVQKGLPCQSCYRRFRMADCGHISCLRDLSVEEVYRKVEGVL